MYPFIDENGRTKRLILNLELIKSGLLPINIKFADKREYYACFDDYYGVNLYNTVAIYIKESSIKNKSYNIDLSNETINSNYNLIVLNLEFDKWKTSSSILAKRTTLTKENSVLFLENLESPKIKINR